MTVDEAGQLVSCSMDDTVRYTNLTLRDYRCVRGGRGQGRLSRYHLRQVFSALVTSIPEPSLSSPSPRPGAELVQRHQV